MRPQMHATTMHSLSGNWAVEARRVGEALQAFEQTQPAVKDNCVFMVRVHKVRRFVFKLTLLNDLLVG